MSGTSDGNKKGEAGKLKMDHQKLKKIRSHSIGSINLSQAEVNRIIGAEDKKTVKETKTEADKDIKTGSENVNINIHGGSTSNLMSRLRCQDENKGEMRTENVFSDLNEVFKPRHSVPRSPPTTNNEDKNNTEENEDREIIENVTKRPRLEPSPATGSNIKRLRDRSDTPSKNKQGGSNLESAEKNEGTKEQQDIFNTDKIIFEIFNALDKVNEIVMGNRQGEIILSKDNEHNFRTSTTSIHKCLTLLVHKLGTVEKENTELKYKLKQSGSNDPVKNTYAHKTYAEIVHAPNLTKTRESAITLEKEAWKTPPKVKRHETLIKIENVKSPKEAMQQLKKEINSKEVGGGFKNVRQLKSGAVLVESYDNSQQEKLNAVLRNKTHITIKETESMDPMFLITGIEKGYSNQEFIEELIRLNDEIEEELGYNIKDKIKVIARKQCRNPNKENWILQASPNIAKWFLKKSLINFDLVRVYVQEYFNLAMCFKCCGFGHVAKYCSGSECCYKCGGQHSAKNCQEQGLCCTNCEKMKYNEKQHSARDINCPVYKDRLSRFKTQIKYEETFL